MSALAIAKRERKGFTEELRRHLKGCLACHRWADAQQGRPCSAGEQLDQAIRLMDKQIELLTPPPQPEYVQDALPGF